MILISWTRILEGRILNPRIGRDVLVGVARGRRARAHRVIVVVRLTVDERRFGMLRTDEPPAPPRQRSARGALLHMVPNARQNAMLMSFVFVIELSTPHASASLFVITAILAPAAFGYYASRGGQPLFGRILSRE